MIAFANKETAPLVRSMWQICFDDCDPFMDIYFTQKYKDENTLVYFVQGEAVASLQMLPYTIEFYGQSIPFAYMSGLCTLPFHRKKGYMDQLIHQAHDVLRQRDIPLAILIPAQDWLYGFYEKYGYEQVFMGDETEIPLAEMVKQSGSLDAAYNLFDIQYNILPFSVHKTFDDFKTIVADYNLEEDVVKTNLSGMARIVDPHRLLSLYAAANIDKTFTIGVSDNLSKDISASTYSIHNGSVTYSDTDKADLSVDIRLLCRLLFGFQIEKLDTIYQRYFSAHNPVMNLMLE